MVQQKKDFKTPTKLNLKAEEDLWKKVLKHKIDFSFENLNDAVIDLIERGLKKV